MKNIFRNITTCTLVLTALVTGKTRAQQPAGNHSLLWKVSGNGLHRPSYLYGTIHLICEQDFIMTEKVKKAFEASQQLVIETNILDPNIGAIMQKAMAADVPLSKKLSPQDYTTVDSILQLKCGIPLKPLDNYKLIATLSLLMQKAFPCETTRSYEKAFIEMAQKEKRNIGALEGLEEQADFLTKSYTDEQIISQVKAFDSSKEDMKQLVQLYKDQDLDGMYKNMTKPGLMDENAIHWLLEIRNNNWAERMPEMMKKESCFFAVGAAHLPGPAGMIKLLRKKGYTVTPIMN